MTRSIAPVMPFEIAYFEEFQSENEAICRERYFKSSAGREIFEEEVVLVAQCLPG